jgi:hypothetical protein
MLSARYETGTRNRFWGSGAVETQLSVSQVSISLTVKEGDDEVNAVQFLWLAVTLLMQTFRTTHKCWQACSNGYFHGSTSVVASPIGAQGG